MEFYNDYLDEFDEFSFDEETLLARIEKSLSWINDGVAILNLESIEETILLCIENEFVDEGLVLVEAVLDGNVLFFEHNLELKSHQVVNLSI